MPGPDIPNTPITDYEEVWRYLPTVLSTLSHVIETMLDPSHHPDIAPWVSWGMPSTAVYSTLADDVSTQYSDHLKTAQGILQQLWKCR